ncbi:hypothetical protein [Sphingorhabdus sp.]|jgi:hypothetical protein|uniref:hypothetical protein n=1 Tax=Sphingorhabdus sp. TaxID=1902408 RepID=UPI0037CC3314
MMRRTQSLILALALLPQPALSGCGPAPTDPGPGGVSVEDARELDRAAEKLDAQQANPPLFPEKDEAAEDAQR